MAWNPHSAIAWPWYGLAIVWLATLAFTKPTVRLLSGPVRMFQLSIVLLGLELLGGSYFRSGRIAVRIFPDSAVLAWTGLAVTAFGCLWAIWARLVLGANWSGRAAVKESHELILSGPYAITRHPIYSGILVGALGTSLTVGELRCVAGLVLLVIGFAVKMGQEERLMDETFPEVYRAYRLRVRALIPGVF